MSSTTDEATPGEDGAGTTFTMAIRFEGHKLSVHTEFPQDITEDTPFIGQAILLAAGITALLADVDNIDSLMEAGFQKVTGEAYEDDLEEMEVHGNA